MCGIVGFVNPSVRPEARELLERMNDSLVHRGPDDAGTFLSSQGEEGARNRPQVGLAMRRLSIIDLSGGHQPITNEDETCWIVFNGEIYNHQELRRDLEARGHVYRTHSDTESILHAYEEYGVDCVHKLRGMFAFAIWDERQNRLFIARDPVGIKPLYWTRTGDRLLFASEIKALFQEPSVPRKVNQEGLHHYLTYLYAPAPLTMFDGIQQLPPGHRMVFQNGNTTVEEYWAGPEAMMQGGEGGPVTKDQVWEVLRESVNAHMLSDVPLGAFLSGGLDSTAIVALMAEESKHPVRTFCIGFRASGLYDELKYARQVAGHLRTDHNEFVVDPDAVGLLPEILRHLDEPLADASVIPNYLVANLARKFVKVALTGIGGDELFGGYRRYFGDAMARKWQRVPRPLRRNLLLPALRMVPASGDTAIGDTSRLVQKFLEPLDLDPEQRYLAWNAFFSDDAKSELYADGRGGLSESHKVMLPYFDRVKHRPFPDRAMYVDLKSYLPGDPLFLSDRMTMANSLEARVPFVDPKVMEFAARIPLSQKIQGQNTKVILREMLEGRVPNEIIHRPKRGFGTPIDLWLRRELSGLADKLLSPKVLQERGYFRPEYVQWLREQQTHGKQDFSQHLWAILVFELWQRIFIDNDFSNRKGLTLDDLGLGGELARPTLPQATVEHAAREAVPAEPRSLNGHTDRPLRILMAADVDPIHVIGGAERMLNEHSLRLAERGHRVVVLTRRENPELPEEETYRGVRVIRHPMSTSGGAVSFVRTILREGGAAFSRIVAQEPFDILNVHQPLVANAVVGRPESANLPILYTYLSPWSDEYRIRRMKGAKPLTGLPLLADQMWENLNSHARERMERQALVRSDRMLVLSDFSTSQLSDIHGMPVEKVTVIPGGVDTDKFRAREDRLALREKLNLPDGLLLFTVRNLEPRMGLDALVSAMSEVVKVRPDCHLYIGGSGPTKSALQEQVRELGLQENVRFTGFIPEERLADYYATADLFVLPTRYLEGFGLVTIEALGCGTPVMGTPVGGTQEILRNFDPRFLFRSAEAAEIADRLIERIPEIEGNQDLRDQCRQYALDTYSWNVLIPQVEDLMARMVDEHAGRKVAAEAR